MPTYPNSVAVTFREMYKVLLKDCEFLTHHNSLLYSKNCCDNYLSKYMADYIAIWYMQKSALVM